MSYFQMDALSFSPVIGLVVAKMWSNQVYSYLLTAISGFGTFLNLKSFAYIRKTFDRTNNLFNFLAQDSLVSGICSGIFCTTNLVMLFNEELLRSKLGCAAHFVGIYLPAMLGPVSSLLISLRRFVQLKYPKAIAHNSLRANLMGTVMLIVLAIYFVSFMLFDTLTDGKSFKFILICQASQGDLEQLGNESSKPVLRTYFGLVNMAIMGSTIALDICNHRLALQNNFLDSEAGVVITKEDKQRREKIPKRATIINSCFFLNFTCFSAVLLFTNLDLESKILLVTLANGVVNAIRNPLISRFAFHVNNQIIRQTVEDRRNNEIQEALQKREERRKQKEQNENENGPTNQDPGRIVTVSELVEKNPLPRRSSLTRIDV